MKRINWVGWGSAGVAALTLAACGDGDTSAAPTGEDRAGSSNGDFESAGAGGAAIAGGLPACGDAGPASTWDAYRRSVPILELVELDTSGGGAGSTGSDSEAPAADGCTITMAESPNETTDCAGVARVTGGGPVFEIGGYRITWTASRIDPPSVRTGESVWLRYHRARPVVCSFCGQYDEATLEIRRSEEGELLWYGIDGHRAPPPSDATLDELFGAPVRKDELCESSRAAHCYDVERTSYDHTLLGTPEQRIPFAKATRVTSPNGTFEVFWTESNDVSSRRNDTCSDGPAPAFDNSFAASRLPTE